ncbi:hypothetical protein VNO77_26789 [Canavalia gladiata]|uniref:Uncharacterized protein n=1 Tax=Canavalia gladiata TaxID=3824 RepID=A0AAN9KUN7_CANGL
MRVLEVYVQVDIVNKETGSALSADTADDDGDGDDDDVDKEIMVSLGGGVGGSSLNFPSPSHGTSIDGRCQSGASLPSWHGLGFIRSASCHGLILVEAVDVYKKWQHRLCMALLCNNHDDVTWVPTPGHVSRPSLNQGADFWIPSRFARVPGLEASTFGTFEARSAILVSAHCLLRLTMATRAGLGSNVAHLQWQESTFF